MADSKRICSVDDCGKLSLARGWCSKHYARWRAHGSTCDPKPQYLTSDWLRERVNHKETGCLEWPFGKTGTGYGNIVLQGRNINAHRLMCIWAHGPAPKGQEVAHNCGNRGCVNPRHLRWDTHVGNCADRLKMGTHPIGEKVKTSVLDEDTVREIRKEWPNSTCDKLALKYGCKRNTIWKAATGRTWGHVQ